MWMSIAFLAVMTLAAGDSGQLSLTNVRSTYGILGPTRPDDKFLPGDALVLSFDIGGAMPDANGKIQYSIAMEVADSKGKVLFRQAPRDLAAQLPAGANSLPALATIDIGQMHEAGDFTLRVKVTDRSAKTSAELTRNFTVLPRALGIVRVSMTGDAESQTPIAALPAGKSGWINFAAVGFERDKATGQPDVVAEMQIRSESGKAVLRQPETGEINKDVPEKTTTLPLQFQLEIKRPGKYTLELKIMDKVAGGSATLSFPVTVSP